MKQFINFLLFSVVRRAPLGSEETAKTCCLYQGICAFYNFMNSRVSLAAKPEQSENRFFAFIASSG